jgi:hypothetical protein
LASSLSATASSSSSPSSSSAQSSPNAPNSIYTRFPDQFLPFLSLLEASGVSGGSGGSGGGSRQPRQQQQQQRHRLNNTVLRLPLRCLGSSVSPIVPDLASARSALLDLEPLLRQSLVFSRSLGKVVVEHWPSAAPLPATVLRATLRTNPLASTAYASTRNNSSSDASNGGGLVGRGGNVFRDTDDPRSR